MTFNIGSDKVLTINRLSRLIQAVTKIRIKPIYIPERIKEAKIAISDHTLSKKYFGYKNRVSLEEGLKSTWEYVKKTGYKKPTYTSLELQSPYIPENWRPKKHFK